MQNRPAISRKLEEMLLANLFITQGIREIPQHEKDLIINLTLDILEQNKTTLERSDPELEMKLQAHLTAGIAAAKYFEMKLLQKECQQLEKDILDPAKTAEMALNIDKLTTKLRQLNSYTPNEEKRALTDKKLQEPNFIKDLLERSKQLKAEKASQKEGKPAAPRPKSTKDFADEMNQMLLGVLNPHMITGQTIPMQHIESNRNGIVEQARNDMTKNNPLDVNNAKSHEDEPAVKHKTPFEIKPEPPK